MDNLPCFLLLIFFSIIIVYMQRQNRFVRSKLQKVQKELDIVRAGAGRSEEKLQQAQKIMNKLNIFKSQLNDFFKEIETRPENASAVSKKARLNFRSFLSFYEKWVPEIVVNEQTEEIISRIKQKYFSLNKKEMRVMTYILQGYTSKEIALLISKSVKNVEHARTVIRRKMQIPDGKTLLEYLEKR
jgi:predicted nuclease with TOPRIM domain